ncbi:MAG: pyridoxal phosphate-dependent aminotransferase [Alcanivoracaceae bacterium]
MLRQASRNDRIAPFHVMALLGRAQALQSAGHDVIHLEVGEPDFPTPAPILAAGQRALAQGLTHYTPATGLPALREAIAGYYRSRFGVDVEPSRIIVTPGASGALQLALALLVDPGDGVLLADPGYPCNRHFVELVNGDPQSMPLGDDLRVTADLIRKNWQPSTVATLLATPDNPTGAVLSASDCAGIATTVAALGGGLIVDEIYQGLVYRQPIHTVLTVAPDALVLNSFSKYFGMTGWRLGWMVAPAAHVPALERMAQNFFIAPATMSQHAALAAFAPDALAELDRRRDVLDGRRRLLLAALPELGMRVMGQPEGAFYLYVDISALTHDSFAFCAQLLEQEFVALTPGADFGQRHGPERCLRIAYTTDEARLQEALARLRRFVGRMTS